MSDVTIWRAPDESRHVVVIPVTEGGCFTVELNDHGSIVAFTARADNPPLTDYVEVHLDGVAMDALMSRLSLWARDYCANMVKQLKLPTMVVFAWRALIDAMDEFVLDTDKLRKELAPTPEFITLGRRPLPERVRDLPTSSQEEIVCGICNRKLVGVAEVGEPPRVLQFTGNWRALTEGCAHEMRVPDVGDLTWITATTHEVRQRRRVL
jgi:hypothetical protein